MGWRGEGGDGMGWAGMGGGEMGRGMERGGRRMEMGNLLASKKPSL